jgi:hypothetical protein
MAKCNKYEAYEDGAKGSVHYAAFKGGQGKGAKGSWSRKDAEGKGSKSEKHSPVSLGKHGK